MSEKQHNKLIFYIVIPAYNEEEFIGKTLDSLINQTQTPDKIIVVDDNSTDNTADIVTEFCQQYDFIDLVQTNSLAEHQPGSKVVRAFYKGLAELDQDFDILCKFDADLIFPENYIKTLNQAFQENPKLGMAGGFCYIQKNNTWELENLTNKDHLRGALKTYRKDCFKDIDGLKEAMGWDTLDELLAQYHNWEVKTFENLKVKHLRPTGKSYQEKAKLISGEALYRMQYGSLISFISSAKMAWLKKDFKVLTNNMKGFYTAKKEKTSPLVSQEEGKWIRKHRWKNMFKKLF